MKRLASNHVWIIDGQLSSDVKRLLQVRRTTSQSILFAAGNVAAMMTRLPDVNGEFIVERLLKERPDLTRYLLQQRV
jgi:hypothetical protein